MRGIREERLLQDAIFPRSKLSAGIGERKQILGKTFSQRGHLSLTSEQGTPAEHKDESYRAEKYVTLTLCENVSAFLHTHA